MKRKYPYPLLTILFTLFTALCYADTQVSGIISVGLSRSAPAFRHNNNILDNFLL